MNTPVNSSGVLQDERPAASTAEQRPRYTTSAAADADAARSAKFSALDFAVYLLIGTFFGIILIKSEVVSWFRIQEMFRFDSFHMYGIIGSAVVVAGISVQVIKKMGIRSLRGDAIVMPPKVWGKGVRYWLGGTIFGLGWALLGACPGPMFALIGGGFSVMLVALAAALAGTYAYSFLRPRLPH